MIILKKHLNQAEIIKSLTNKELVFQLYLSQAIIFIVAIISGFFVIDSWFSLLRWDLTQLLLYGVLPAIAVVLIDILLMRFLPRKYYDDGGINERVFTSLSKVHIPLLVLFVAISEEMLFRGVIHTTFGFFIGSVTFALVHVRYLCKPVLFVSIMFMSFFIGYLYEITDNLLVTIVAHFFVDLILAYIIKFKWGEEIDIEEGKSVS
ncbi:CPBP family intramembrane glutamic endopeptidase [Salirhabdus sp. Marseille-P4669]|uniref:CPBP family intramembrane glutamic endopeptidase n=1 Tax=Salirhabdus sp. Marseille-P4669 TaxID=2042310 RepID=UPI001F3EADEC|nr:type II CAAX endopeptidase family protein [Salirhabdus sp. Marseille-P4669]